MTTPTSTVNETSQQCDNTHNDEQTIENTNSSSTIDKPSSKRNQPDLHDNGDRILVNGSLPRLYPHSYNTTTNRPKRTKTIPHHIYDSIYFCIEYPNGVYIDKHGVPDTSVPVDIPTPDIKLLPTDEIRGLDTPERIEQLQMHYDEKVYNSHASYIQQDEVEYIPETDSESSDDIHQEYALNCIDDGEDNYDDDIITDEEEYRTSSDNSEDGP